MILSVEVLDWPSAAEKPNEVKSGTTLGLYHFLTLQYQRPFRSPLPSPRQQHIPVKKLPARPSGLPVHTAAGAAALLFTGSTRASKSWWEEFHRPPRLKLLEVIKGKSLDELDELMLQFERDFKDLDSNSVPSQTIATEVETQEHENSEAAGLSPDASSASDWGP